MSRPRTWTDEQLRAAVAASRSMVEITTALGLCSGGRNNNTIRRRADQLGLVLPNGWHRPREPRHDHVG